MKKTITIVIFLMLIAGIGTLCGSSLPIMKLSGKIGKYSIEMEFDTIDGFEHLISGRYRYAGKTAYIDLRGGFWDDCITLEESVNGNVTGEFFLTAFGDSLHGWWGSGDRWYRTGLKITQGSPQALYCKTLQEYRMNTSTGIRGAYGTGGNYLNDYWFEDTPPRIELGFGGGYVILEPHGSDSLQFQVEVVCGPTYHFAMAEGMAVKQGDVYVWNNGEGCEIRITPGERSVQLKASASLECGFGARAYLDHDFVKISDQCVFGPDVSLHSIKQAEDKR